MFNRAGPISVPSSKLNLPDKAGPGKILAVRKDEVVEGRIIKTISPHRAIILIKGKELLARTQGVPMRPGHLASFKVAETSPQCILKLLGLIRDQKMGITGLPVQSHARAAPYRGLRALFNALGLSREAPVREATPHILKQMEALVGRICLRPHQKPCCRFLQSFMEGSGLMWENKLKRALLSGLVSRHETEALIDQDLKGLAFRALTDSGRGKGFFTKAITTFLDDLEHHQCLNLSAWEEKGKLLFVIPMQRPDDMTFAQLLIDLGAKPGGRDGEDNEDAPFKLTLFLSLSALGPLRVDASVVEKAISISFLVSDEATRSFFNRHTPALQGQLERHGFSLQQVRCRLEKRAKLAAMSLADAIIDAEEHTISLIV